MTLDEFLLRFPRMAGADEGDDTGDDTADKDADKDAETVQMPKAEADALRREAAEARRATKKAKADADKAEQEKAKASGDFQKLAEENQRRADEAEKRLAARDRQDRVTSQATRLGFRDPTDAHRFLDDEDTEDEQAVKRALEAVKRDKPYLIGPKGRSGADVTGDDNAGDAKSIDAQIRQAAGYAP